MRNHQMSVNGKVGGITRDDVLTLGKFAGLRGGGSHEIDEILAARARWPEFAAVTGVPAKDVDRIAQAFPALVSLL